MIDVNVKGLICLGDKLKASEVPGKAEAIKYDILDERQFGIRCIGKVVEIYEDDTKVKVLLDLE